MTNKNRVRESQRGSACAPPGAAWGRVTFDWAPATRAQRGEGRVSRPRSFGGRRLSQPRSFAGMLLRDLQARVDQMPGQGRRLPAPGKGGRGLRRNLVVGDGEQVALAVRGGGRRRASHAPAAVDDEMLAAGGEADLGRAPGAVADRARVTGGRLRDRAWGST